MDSWLSSTVAKYACAVAAGIGVIYYASRAYGFYSNSKSANESEEEKHNVVATNASVSDSDEIPQDDSMLVDNQVPAGYQEDRGASNGLSADPGLTIKR